MIKAGALTETRQEKKKKPLGQKQENMIPHREPRRQNRKRQTIRTPRATRLTLHHINPSTEREPWETSPAVTSPALIQPVTTSSRSTAAARADTLSHSVGREKKKGFWCSELRSERIRKLKTLHRLSHHDKKNMPSLLSSTQFYVFFQQ